MLGNFQQSHLRIEVEAPSQIIRDSLLNPQQMRQWLWTQRFSPELSEKLHSGLTFTSWIGSIAIQHQVEIANDNCLRLLLSQGIDGYHEWCWETGWVQSQIEGISLLPINLGQTISLMSLRQFVSHQAKQVKKAL